LEVAQQLQVRLELRKKNGWEAGLFLLIFTLSTPANTH